MGNRSMPGEHKEGAEKRANDFSVFGREPSRELDDIPSISSIGKED